MEEHRGDFWVADDNGKSSSRRDSKARQKARWERKEYIFALYGVKTIQLKVETIIWFFSPSFFPMLWGDVIISLF